MTFPTEAVDTYLRGHLPGVGSIYTAQKFDVGQSNPTFRLQTDARSASGTRSTPSPTVPYKS